MTIHTQLKTNKQIRALQVRLIDETSRQIGTMETWVALREAQEKGLDLVEISPHNELPVCKLMDYGKYVFEEKKKEKEQRRTQRISQADLKEIQVSPVIQDGDLKIKIKNIQRIIDEGDKVKIIIKFSGRQLKHAELGHSILEKIVMAMNNVIIEKQPSFEGKNLFLTLSKNLNK